MSESVGTCQKLLCVLHLYHLDSFLHSPHSEQLDELLLPSATVRAITFLRIPVFTVGRARGSSRLPVCAPFLLVPCTNNVDLANRIMHVDLLLFAYSDAANSEAFRRPGQVVWGVRVSPTIMKAGPLSVLQASSLSLLQVKCGYQSIKLMLPKIPSWLGYGKRSSTSSVEPEQSLMTLSLAARRNGL